MIFFIYSYLFILGSVLGSFYNVVGLRVPQNESIVRPRSHCTSCGRTLTALDMVPVFSWLFLRGKCRSCGAKVSVIYPVIELATGLLFMLAFYHFGFNLEVLVSFTFISLLVIIIVSDIAYMLIPDKVLIFFTPLLIVERIFIPLDPWWDPLAGAVFGFGLLFLIAVISKGGMGGGDIKLFFVIGLALGFKLTLLTFMLACFLGAFYGVFSIIMGKHNKKQPIPFGPFIAIGAILAYFYGNDMINWYISML
jgi:leader peptidase (prepilin peptidase) / N-methyltransferase